MRRRRLASLMAAGALVALLWAIPGEAFTLTYTAPTTNTDGSPLTDLAAFILYWRATSAEAWSPLGWIGPTALSVVIEPPLVGEFVVRAVNALGIESENSNIATAKKPGKVLITGGTR